MDNFFINIQSIKSHIDNMSHFWRTVMAGNITYVKQKSGVIYAYENLGTWDPINKKKICRRKLLGRFNPETGAIEPTDNRNKRLKKEYVPEPYEKDYKMPRTVKERGEEILRLLKELYELKASYAALDKKYRALLGKTADAGKSQPDE